MCLPVGAPRRLVDEPASPGARWALRCRRRSTPASSCPPTRRRGKTPVGAPRRGEALIIVPRSTRGLAGAVGAPHPRGPVPRRGDDAAFAPSGAPRRHDRWCRRGPGAPRAGREPSALHTRTLLSRDAVTMRRPSGPPRCRPDGRESWREHQRRHADGLCAQRASPRPGGESRAPSRGSRASTVVGSLLALCGHRQPRGVPRARGAAQRLGPLPVRLHRRGGDREHDEAEPGDHAHHGPPLAGGASPVELHHRRRGYCSSSAWSSTHASWPSRFRQAMASSAASLATGAPSARPIHGPGPLEARPELRVASLLFQPLRQRQESDSSDSCTSSTVLSSMPAPATVSSRASSRPSTRPSPRAVTPRAAWPGARPAPPSSESLAARHHRARPLGRHQAEQEPRAHLRSAWLRLPARCRRGWRAPRPPRRTRG